MDGQRRLVELAGEAAVEIGVVLGRDLGLGLGPERRAVGDAARLGAGLLDERRSAPARAPEWSRTMRSSVRGSV